MQAHHREKNFLNFKVAQVQENEEVVNPVIKKRQRVRKLEHTVTQQENVIRNLEKALRDYLDRTGNAANSYNIGGRNRYSLQGKVNTPDIERPFRFSKLIA